MCGIAGFFSRSGKPAPEGLLINMTRILRHRGPDGEGFFSDSDFYLGHRRLSIIDIEGGHQPMTNEDGSIVIVFNGEIYNYIELRDELISKGHRFQTRSDTEVIIHLYEEEDLEMFSRLNGMFAIAIADLKHKKLILARDRMGKKPLFYYANNDWVVFSSEIKSIIMHPSVSRELDNYALYDYLSLNYIQGVRTMLKDVKRVPPSGFMVFDKASFNQGIFWNIHSFNNQECSQLKEEEAIEELDSLLEDSIRLRLRSDVPVGIFLSGGVDSSLIAWKAKTVGANIYAYTASFSEKSYSEEKYARAVASSIGMDIKVLEIGLDVKDIFQSLVYHADEPMADSSCLPVYLLSKETSKFVKVVLGGDGGDEGFAGYLTYKATSLARKIRGCIPSNLLKLSYFLVNQLPTSDQKVSLEYKMKRFFRGLLMPPGAAHFSWNGTWCQWEKNNLLSHDFLSSIQDIKDTYIYLSSKYRINLGYPELKSLQIADICEYLPNDILAKIDHMSMANGLEVRSPFLDYRIIEWALTLPPDLKLNKDKTTKYLLKRYMSKRFDSRLANRPKQGFSIPINKWIREDLGVLVEEYLSEKALAETGIFNVKNVSKMLDAHRNKKASYGFEIWGLLVFMVWRKLFLDQS